MVLNTRLGESPYVAGEKFTIADIASFCWVRASPNILGFDLDDWPAIRKWHDLILARETVQRALKIPESKMTEAQFAVIVAGKRKEMLERKNTDLS
jgi:glutathione S-transferase